MFGFKDEKDREACIGSIIRSEWDMFQSVNNIGGRAGCQDDFNTFNIMRSSQFKVWNDFMLKSYAKDLELAMKDGRNLVMEKYAFMMENTDPEYFNNVLAPNLPIFDGETIQMIDEIVWYMLDCEKALEKAYPKLAKAGRPLSAEADTHVYTSIETYARGELKTYSKETLRLYLDEVRNLRARGVNMAVLVREETVKLYGYKSLEDAENRL